MQLSLIQSKIYEIRGQKIMLDFDLAALYEVETRALKQAVKRNPIRFPKDFMFQLTAKEVENLVSQNVIPSKSKLGGAFPFAFTKQGVAMLSSVLNSEKAIAANIAIMRTFVLIRQYALQYKELHDKLVKLEKKYNKNFKEIYHALNLLLEDKAALEEQKNREPIGFKTKSST
jgi:hypothetical protein